MKTFIDWISVVGYLMAAYLIITQQDDSNIRILVTFILVLDAMIAIQEIYE